MSRLAQRASRTNSTASARVAGARSSATVYGSGEGGAEPGSPVVPLLLADGLRVPVPVSPSDPPVHPTSISVPAITATTGLCATMPQPPLPNGPGLS